MAQGLLLGLSFLDGKKSLLQSCSVDFPCGLGREDLSTRAKCLEIRQEKRLLIESIERAILAQGIVM